MGSKKEKINFELDRDQLLELKHKNNDAYQLIMSLKKEEADYCETLDKEKLKKECELGYFCISDLFTKEQIRSAHIDDSESRHKDSFERFVKSRIDAFYDKYSDVEPKQNGQQTAFLDKSNQSICDNTKATNRVANKIGNSEIAYKHFNLIHAIREKIEMKIRVTPEQSEVVQKIFFALGGCWRNGDRVVYCKDCPFLFIRKNDDMLELSHTKDEVYFKTIKCSEYSFEKGAFA